MTKDSPVGIINGIRLSWGALARMLTYTILIVLAYGALKLDIAVIQTRQDRIEADLGRRLDRVENKIDTLLAR